MQKEELWLRIKNYHFDAIVAPSIWEVVLEKFGGTDASTKAFAHKIARKHVFSFHLAMCAIQEYKKFVYLGVISKFKVTPSYLIDVVWHEHILFSRAYRDFCVDVIEHELDHYPELLPNEEQTERYKKQYANTINLYIQEFGINPPELIWGATKFETDKKWQSTETQNLDYGTPLHQHFYFENNQEDYPEFSTDENRSSGATGDWGDVGSDSSGGCSGDGSDGGDGGGCSGGGCGGGGCG
jgi:uncharacterized membrane protein YgcG